MMKQAAFLLVTSLVLSASAAERRFDGPTMGWSSWNTFSVHISEDIIKGQADAMVDQGLAAVGYNYINIDDGFLYGRNPKSHLVIIHPTRFPNGIKVVADYIHSKGLKAGIYSDAGDCTCGSISNGDTRNTNVGFYGYDQIDADYYFKTCGFDFIKVDYCGGRNQNLNERERYTAIRQAMDATGIPGLKYNVCRWDYPGTWISDIADSWRTTGDISCSWSSVKYILGENLYLSAYCHDGHYNDMDMLEVGRSLTEEEDKTHFGMWCIMSSPLLIGCNMETLKPATLELLKNQELIALNQDTLGLQSYVALHHGDTYVLVKDIEKRFSNTRAVAFYNPSDTEQQMAMAFSDVDLAGKVQVRDLYTHTDLGPMEGILKATVPAHGCRIYRLEAQERLERNIYEAETAYLSSYQEIYNNEALGTAVYRQQSAGSGGAVVEWLGGKPENDLQWQHVWSKEGGKYTLTLHYATGETRPLSIQVNGEDVASTNVASTGGFSTYGTRSWTISLQPGENTIRLYTNSSSYMPNIDCMKLQPAGSSVTRQRQVAALYAQVTAAMYPHLPDALLAATQTTLDKYAAPESLTAAQQSTAITKLQSALTTLEYAQQQWRNIEPWLTAVEKNLAVSLPSESLNTYLQQLMTAQKNYEGASTQARVQSTAIAYVNVLKRFFTLESVYPDEDNFFDFTVLVANPGFNDHDGGWNQAPTYRDRCGEFHQTTFDMKQTITKLPAGHYRVGLQALYRTSTNDGGKSYRAGTEVIPALFYAGDESVSIRSLYSYDWKEAADYGSVDQLNGYPHSMLAASIAFDAGAYRNWVETDLAQAGSLTVGIKSDKSANSSWCCFDNLQLLYRPFDSPDAIATPSATGRHHYIYDLTGRKVKRPQKGIHIVQGRKVVYGL